ncbi:MAG TPA: cysteine hydrolase [Casimicrobiaceae bacterium]|nr:cysteine hydrolase [Casimicrobiaceae bacterium]
MLKQVRSVLGTVAAVAALAACAIAQSAQAATIVDEWASVKAPPAPELHPVTVDPKTTALLMLDFNKQTCNLQRRPRCIASLPQVEKLLKEARAAGTTVAYSLGGGGHEADIAKEVAPTKGDHIVSSGVDKFRNTDLDKVLKDKGIKTVIVVGTAAHGAVIYTASTAAVLGFKVIVPVDGVSADIPYAEQYVVWHLVNAPIISNSVTLTSIDQLKF